MIIGRFGTLADGTPIVIVDTDVSVGKIITVRRTDLPKGFSQHRVVRAVPFATVKGHAYFCEDAANGLQLHAAQEEFYSQNRNSRKEQCPDCLRYHRSGTVCKFCAEKE